MKVRITRAGIVCDCASEHDAQELLSGLGYCLEARPCGDTLARRLRKGPINFKDHNGRAVSIERIT